METLVDVCVLDRRPERLLYDKPADADWLRVALEDRGIEQITPHLSAPGLHERDWLPPPPGHPSERRIDHRLTASLHPAAHQKLR